MEAFQGFEFVRLRSREHGTYLYAGEDGRSVRLDARLATLNAVWAVQLLRAPAPGSGGGGNRGRGALYLLLRGAYGRYLGAPDASERWLLSSFRRHAAQRDFDEPEVKAIMWRAVGTGAGRNVVLLHDKFGRSLRANARYMPCRAGVAVHNDVDLAKTMQWIVESVTPRFIMPEVPIHDSERAKLFACACPWRFSPPQREIRWVRADNSGNFSEEHWVSFQYDGRSAVGLRRKLVSLVGDDLTLCVRAGRHGEPSPLLIDLPRSREPLYIVAIRANSTADHQLIFPDVYAETEEGRLRIG